MLKIVITGPESSGKTTLAQALAAHYRVPWVAEYARDYLERLTQPYQEKDLLAIAQGQMQWKMSKRKPIRVCSSATLVCW